MQTDPAFRERMRYYDMVRTYKRHYGITFERYCEMFEEQLGRCAICERKFEQKTCYTSNRNNKLCVDHNHDTGAVRGLLCGDCNRGIGFFRENKIALNKAIQYLGGD